MKKFLIKFVRKLIISEIEENRQAIIDAIADKTDIPHLNEAEEKVLVTAVLDAAVKIMSRA